MGTSLWRIIHLIMKLIIASLLLVAVTGQFTDITKTNNSTEDRVFKYILSANRNQLFKLKLYNRETPNGITIFPGDFDPNILNFRYTPLKVFIHGFASEGGKYHKKGITTNFINVEAAAGRNVNVIIVSWNSYITYVNAALRAMDVGEALADWLYINGPKGDLLHLIGHSLGAQAVGRAGRKLTLANHSPLRVTGLDPAGPLFEWFVSTDSTDSTPKIQIIGKDSGKFVDIIHTNPGVLGVKAPYGHVDFYVDGGYKKVGYFRKNHAIGDKLSHSYATTLFIESILDPFNQKFRSQLCASVEPTVNTLFTPICAFRNDGFKYENYLGMGAGPVANGLSYSYRTDLPKTEEQKRDEDAEYQRWRFAGM